MLSKIIDFLKNRRGFLSREGYIVNWKEVHALGLGCIDGIGFKGQGYRLEFWLKKHPDVNKRTMHYYEKGYFWARLFKYVATAAIIFYFGGSKALEAFLI